MSVPDSSQQRPAFAFLATLALVSLLVAGSLLPENTKHAIGTEGLWHRPLHLILFAATAFTARAAFTRRPISTPLLLLALAFSLESVEHLLYRNIFEWHDIRDDLIGIIAGLALAGRWRWWSARKTPHSKSVCAL